MNILDFLVFEEPEPPILFCSTSQEFAEFSNFYASPFVLDGYRWPTVEHYYQAMKSNDPVFWVKVLKTSSPGRVKQLGRWDIEVDSSWDDRKYEIMQKAVEAKFSQNPRLRTLLLSTGDRPLHEDRPDSWWGGGPNYRGCRDWLGEILVKLRASFRDE